MGAASWALGQPSKTTTEVMLSATSKRERPVAVCAGCGAFSRDATLIHKTHRCSAKKRGAWRSMLHPDDWKECERSGATGRHAGQRCDECRGEGWHNVRRARP